MYNANQPFDLYLTSFDFFALSNIEQLKAIENLYTKEKVHFIYDSFSNIKNFLESEITKEFINKVKENKIKLVITQNEYCGIKDEDLEYIKNNLWFFSAPNVLYYQASYKKTDYNFGQNLYVGVIIHHLLKDLLVKNDYNHFEQKHTKVFLTLNNKRRPSRIHLFDLYNSIQDKNKILASFNFKNIFLEENLFHKDNYSHVSLYKQNVIEFYKKCLFEIVSETHGDAATEKTYKPLICGVPFVLYNKNPLDTIYYYKSLDIDINYFNIDYTDLKNVDDFIKNQLNNDIDILKEKYKDVFEKAKENKIKIFNYFNNVYNKIKEL